MSSWTPPPPPAPQYLASLPTPSNRHSQSLQSLLGSHLDPWWPLTEADHFPLNNCHNQSASTSCFEDSSFSSNSSLQGSPPWPLPLAEDFSLFDQVQNQDLPAPTPNSAGASAPISPEEPFLDLTVLFPELLHAGPRHHTLQRHDQQGPDISANNTTAFSALCELDMTSLGLRNLGESVDGAIDRLLLQQSGQGLPLHYAGEHLGQSLNKIPSSQLEANPLRQAKVSASCQEAAARPASSTIHNAMLALPTAGNPAASALYSTFKYDTRESSASSVSGSSQRKRVASPSAEADPDDEDAQVAIKRQRNTLAARKYRQKRVDRIVDLENALEEVKGERDGLKLQLARREAEVEALREMLSRK